MKNNNYNGILAFLVTLSLILLLAFMWMQFSIETYKDAQRRVDEIERIRDERDDIIEEIIESLGETENDTPQP